MKLKRRNKMEINVVSATSSSKRKVARNRYVHSILPSKLRPRMQEGALMKYFSEIGKPNMARAVARSELNIPVSKMTALHLQSKMELFASRKEAGTKDKKFRNDHMCLLALSSSCVMDVPKNMANLLI